MFRNRGDLTEVDIAIRYEYRTDSARTVEGHGLPTLSIARHMLVLDERQLKRRYTQLEGLQLLAEHQPARLSAAVK